MTTRKEIIDHLRQHKKTLKEQFKITRIALFGSYSKGEENADSDIDILYELEAGEHLGLAKLYDLEVFFKNLFQVEKIYLVNKKYINPVIEYDITDSIIYV